MGKWEGGFNKGGYGKRKEENDVPTCPGVVSVTRALHITGVRSSKSSM